MGLVRMLPRRWLGVHRCRGGFLLADTLTPLGPELPPEMPGNVTVRLVVECPEPRCPQHRLYDRTVPAPAGASLLDVLRAATVWGPHNFTYVAPHAGIGGTLWGPWLSHPGWPHALHPCHGLTPVPTAWLPWRQICPSASSAGPGPSPPLSHPPGLTPRTPPRAPF